MGNALAVVDKAFASLKTSDAEKAAGYVRGLETRLARAQRDSEAAESMPAKITDDALRLAGAALRGGLERLADGYGQGDTVRRLSPYIVGVAWGAGTASGIDILREAANGAMTVDVYEAARGQTSRRAAAVADLSTDPRYAEALRYLDAAPKE